MMMVSHVFASLLLVWPCVSALKVSPGSECASLCLNNPESNRFDGNSSFTSVGEISCHDEEYQSTSSGIKFKNCLDCLQKSRAVNGSETDTSWLLYNLRYSVDVCVFGYPNATKGISSPCNIDYACEPLKKSLEAGGLGTNNTDQLEYCDADGGKFRSAQVDTCIRCFAASSNQQHMASCRLRTATSPWCTARTQRLALLGQCGHHHRPAGCRGQKDQRNDSNPMTTGAIVGIAVGAALLFLGGAGLFFAYYRKQQRDYYHGGEDLASQYTDPRAGSRSISPPIKGGFSSSMSGGDGDYFQPMRAASDYELKSQQIYTNNADYYDRIEKEMQVRRPNYVFDPHKPGSGPTGALPAHHAYIPQAMSRTSERGPSPQPQHATRSNKPDSYALQAYMNAADDSLRLPGPPPGPPPAVHSRDSSMHSRQSSFGRPSPRNSISQPQPAISPANIPPPPPRQPKVPSLVLPSVPRIRIPKKYVPPKIQIQSATPVLEQGEAVPIDVQMQISGPVMDQHDNARFVENPYRQQQQAAAAERAAAERIVEHHVPDRRRRPAYEEITIHTGKSTLYG
ncbi:hypothetical protein PG984_013237 [Apiospora sp. TS-2023a]